MLPAGAGCAFRWLGRRLWAGITFSLVFENSLFFRCYRVLALPECQLFLRSRYGLRRSGLGNGLKTDPEHRSTRLEVKALDGSFMLLNNAVTGTQAESGALAKRFRRVEWIEDSRELRDSWSAVAYFEDHMLSSRLRAHDDLSTTYLSNSVDCIVENMQEDLQKVIVVTQHQRKILLKIAHQGELGWHAREP